MVQEANTHMTEFRDKNAETRQSHFVVIAIIMINIAVFAMMASEYNASSFNSEQAHDWGAQWYYSIDNGQFWRLLTSNYVHFSITHIAFNMMALYYWGFALSRRFGFVELFLLYTISGLCGGLLSYLPHEDIVSAGASGAISGLLGSMLAFHLKGYPEFDRAFLVQNIILNVVIAFAAPVDWKAHLGGFIGGAIFTFARIRNEGLRSVALEAE